MYDELVKDLREISGNRAVPVHMAETAKEAADAIEELTRENESLAKSVNEASEILRRRWIPVTERLPEDDIVCILTNGISDAIGYRGKVFGWHLIWTDYVVESEVTHWMPLPSTEGLNEA